MGNYSGATCSTRSTADSRELVRMRPYALPKSSFQNQIWSESQIWELANFLELAEFGNWAFLGVRHRIAGLLSTYSVCALSVVE